MKKIFSLMLLCAAVVFSSCNNEDDPLIPVAFSNLTANGSPTEMTTALTLTFSQAIPELSADDITLVAGETGATKGTLTDKGDGVYELAVNDVEQIGVVTVEVAKEGYMITPASKRVRLSFKTYVEYGTISTERGNFFVLLPEDKKTYKLYILEGTTNYYKIEDLYGGEQDVEFSITDGKGTFSVPEVDFYNAVDVANYPLHPVLTAMDHPSYGLMRAWLDSDSEYVTFDDLGEGDQLLLNSKMNIDTWYTVAAGFFGWYQDVLKVTAVN